MIEPALSLPCNTTRKITDNKLIGDNMTTIIETPRLILRTWQNEDVNAYYQINQDPKVIELLRGTLTMEQV
jgi:RimJ/RimL family protein N-acetyltransferase